METPRSAFIEQIRALPDQLAALVKDLSDADLTTAYMPGEWTVAQNIHHVADSHMNAFMRFKLIYTEDRPTVKPYDQNLWAETAEATQADVSASLDLIKGLHTRWAALLENVPDDAWEREGTHPETGRIITLDSLLRGYANHGLAHIDQIQRTLAAKPSS